ncbi:uncharacterized protein LOC134766832 [Penaeus indicus]|uniref:uncharacterized protein LOC134766832 n=1 Tax=Penaeus indicus TaxID=29960 RepID=UPI00300BFF3F
MLKYLLYQRHQIPVQYDILVREASMVEKECNETEGYNSNEMECSNHKKATMSPSAYEEDTFKVYQSKQERMKLKQKRKRLRWLEKVKKLIYDYNMIIQKVRSEIEKGDVAAVGFVIGSSVVTSKEFFSINFPHDYAVAGSDAGSDRHVLLQFFRAFVTNEDLVKVVSRPCSIQKLWVMLQKFEAPTPSSTNVFRTEESTQTYSEVCDLIPRCNFSPSRRTRIVKIAVTHKSPLGSPMELTPSIGKLVSQCAFKSSRKNSSKRSLVFGINNVSKRYSFSNDTANHSHSQDLGVTPVSVEKRVPTKSFPPVNNFSDSVDMDDSMSVCSGPGLPGLVTPRNILKGPEPIIETPTVSSHITSVHSTSTASPSRLLASRMSNFNISDAWNDKFSIGRTDCYVVPS